MREVLRRAQRASAVFFGNTGGALDQLQKGLACFVELIDLVACRVFGPPRKLYDTRLVTATIRLTMHLSSSPRGPRRKIAPVKVELWRSVSVGRSSSAQLVFLFEPVADRQQRDVQLSAAYGAQSRCAGHRRQPHCEYPIQIPQSDGGRRPRKKRFPIGES